jgi:hypothetical protein
VLSIIDKSEDTFHQDRGKMVSKLNMYQSSQYLSDLPKGIRDQPFSARELSQK